MLWGRSGGEGSESPQVHQPSLILPSCSDRFPSRPHPKIRHPDQSQPTLPPKPVARQSGATRSVILTEASERSLRGRTSDSFAIAKPAPVPRRRIQLPFLADNGGEIRPLGAGVTPCRDSEAGTGSSSPHPIGVPRQQRRRNQATGCRGHPLPRSEAGTGS